MFRKTKNFFKKGIETFKSYFTEGYEKLPKTPSFNGHHNSGFSQKNTYSEFVDEWEVTDRVMTNSYEKNTNNWRHNKPTMMIGYHELDKVKEQRYKGTSQREKDEKRCLVTKRLKELEILDKNNVDHVLDIQEVLHFYSRLTCPTYCEIVDKFFTEIYSEVFCSPCLDHSMPRRTPVRV